MMDIVTAFVRAIPQVSNLILFMFVVMFIFAIVGMQLFGNTSMSVDTRQHFDTFPAAMLSSLTILIGKYVEIYAAGTDAVGVLMSAVFVYPAALVCYLILVNLFIAILLEQFGDDSKPDDSSSEDSARPSNNAPASTDADEPNMGSIAGHLKPNTEPLPDDPARRFLIELTEHDVFEELIIFLIFLSSLCLAIDAVRLPKDSMTKTVLDGMNLFFTAIFTFEMLAKMGGRGLESTSFVRASSRPWNSLDFTLVTTCRSGCSTPTSRLCVSFACSAHYACSCATRACAL